MLKARGAQSQMPAKWATAVTNLLGSVPFAINDGKTMKLFGYQNAISLKVVLV